jgi:hypothetical protein
VGYSSIERLDGLAGIYQARRADLLVVRPRTEFAIGAGSDRSLHANGYRHAASQ